MLAAYDKATGELVWSTELGSHTDGSPITYMHEGKQYLVFAIGGNPEAAELAGLDPTKVPIRAYPEGIAPSATPAE